MRADVYTKHMTQKDKLRACLRMIGVFPKGDVEQHVGKWHDQLSVNMSHSLACCSIKSGVADPALLGSGRWRITGNPRGSAISHTVTELGQEKKKEMPKSPR